MARRNKFSHTIFRNFVLLLILFTGMMIFSTLLFFNTFQEKSIADAKADYTTNINYYSKKILEKIVLNDNEGVNALLEEVKKTKYIKAGEVNLKKFIFNKDTLLFKTLSFNDKSWELGNVGVDIGNGQVLKFKNSFYYEFIPSLQFNKNEDLIIRYQAYKNQEIKNFVTKLNFSLSIKEETTAKQKEFPFFIDYLVDINFAKEIVDLKIADEVVAQIIFHLDDTLLKQATYDFTFKLFIYTLFVFLPIFIVINFYHSYINRKYVLKPISYLNTFIEQILDNKFTKLETTRFEDTNDFIELTSKIETMSKKIASLSMELNINKENLERRLSTDSLTGLANQKIFELEMKTMFVSSSKGFITLIKIDQLAQITKLNGSVNTNNFIQSFVNSINNTLHKYNKLDFKLFRFYGSEFALITKKVEHDFVEEVIKQIRDNLLLDVKNYNLVDNFVNIGSTPFDLYGSVDTILKSANEACKQGKAKENNGFEIIRETEVEAENKKLEESILEILMENTFTYSFVLDSFDFDKKLLMSELRPKIFDKNGDLIQIGSFAAICEKLNKAAILDRNIIDKALNHIKTQNISHKIIVSISMQSATDKNFLEYLKTLAKNSNEFKDKIILSLTSYTASLNIKKFKEFVNNMDALDIEVLLKRYQTTELELEELKGLPLSYLRLHKEYTHNISNDVAKKHRLKNIIIFSELQDIKVISDIVQSDEDYELLDRLDVYAVSR